MQELRCRLRTRTDRSHEKDPMNRICLGGVTLGRYHWRCVRTDMYMPLNFIKYRVLPYNMKCYRPRICLGKYSCLPHGSNDKGQIIVCIPNKSGPL